MCKWNTCIDVKLCKPRPVSKRIIVKVDSCIANIVQALNDSNIETIGSCCGHRKDDGSILLADGREILIKNQ